MTNTAVAEHNSDTTGLEPPASPPLLWKTPLVSGVLTLIVGALVLGWPEMSILVTATLFGVFLLVAGLAQVFFALTLSGSASGRVLSRVSGRRDRPPGRCACWHNSVVSANNAAASVPDPPSATEVTTTVRLIEPLRKLINPKAYGIDNVPKCGALLVGNHTVLGVLDLPLMCAELWERGRIVRALGDHAQFKVPVWRHMLKRYGVVEGTRANCAELMRRGELILVFPGGGREVAKRKGERYKLVWKNRMGFARLAINYGYPIIPFASVGADDAVDIVLDADNPLLAPERLFVEKVLGSPDSWPIWRGIGPTPIPRPERQYYWFGEPIDTTSVRGCQDDDATVREVRDSTKTAVEYGIQFLLEEREHDKNRSLLGRLLGPGHR